jgi:hypothetical protein
MALEFAMTQLVNIQVEKFITIVSARYPHVPADELRELWAEMSGTPIDVPAPVKTAPKKEKTVKKDSPSQKGKKTGYMLFGEENRKNIKEDNPEMTFGEVSKELGAMWKGLTEDEKSVYNVKAKNITEENHAHPTKGCNYIPVRGKNKGEECGKMVKENGLCATHCKTKSKPKPKQAKVVSDSEPSDSSDSEKSSGTEKNVKTEKKPVPKKVEAPIGKKTQPKPQGGKPAPKKVIPEPEKEKDTDSSEEIEDESGDEEKIETNEVSEEETQELEKESEKDSEEKSEKGSGESDEEEEKKEKPSAQSVCTEIMKGKRKGQVCGAELKKGLDVCAYHAKAKK